MNSTKILGLRTTIYKVTDMSRAKDWYSKAFDTVPYFDEPYYIGFNIGGFELGLQPTENLISENTDNVASYWGVENIEEAYATFVNLGAEEHEKPFNVGGPIVTATVKDPFGNLIGLIYNPTFKAQ
ncbi:lactoylglutathione lyase [Tenacibaculum sp. MAR_2009_124]|uniref:VOC family protein n=1 Tax=Tenacibaculum sp. MAR_2009_124 TaxID=1250059 RepID=UPI00089774FF|nr:VOC family protein [Tenacibaculum sp. MAR_2009_124]SEB50971.1 lactoylglutathione lyase [Tenacibaculum sp. MAR_2009_124]